MIETGFKIPGVEIGKWRKYTDALQEDAEV
jgi:hypothetical protein